MVDKFGSDQQQLANSGGSVISQDGAVLINGDSDGEDALLFGPAALREIQAGVANGDFAIPPVDAEATITADNALPYWTFTDVNSAGAITCAVVADASAGSGNVLRWSIANLTGTGKSAQISRYIPIATSRDRALTIVPDAYISEALGTNARFRLTYSYVKQDLTITGTGATVTRTGIGNILFPAAVTQTAPSDAAYVYLVLTAETTGTTAALTGDIAELKLRSFFSTFYITDSTTPSTYSAAILEQTVGELKISANNASGNVTVFSPEFSTSTNAVIGGDLSVNGNTSTGNLTIVGANSEWVSRVTATAAQSLANNSLVKITFNTASSTPDIGSYDPYGWFDNANDRIEIGQDGFYNITANVGFASNATSRRLVLIYVNGNQREGVQVPASPAGTTLLSISTNVYLVDTDYVEVFALQQSGGALNTVISAGVTPFLSVGRIGA
jgi:hypothetical protein